MNLKDHIAYLIIIATIFYCMAITTMLLWGCTFQEPVKDIILIILTYLTSKAATIIDYFYGASKAPEPPEDKQK